MSIRFVRLPCTIYIFPRAYGNSRDCSLILLDRNPTHKTLFVGPRDPMGLLNPTASQTDPFIYLFLCFGPTRFLCPVQTHLIYFLFFLCLCQSRPSQNAPFYFDFDTQHYHIFTCIDWQASKESGMIKFAHYLARLLLQICPKWNHQITCA